MKPMLAVLGVIVALFGVACQSQPDPAATKPAPQTAQAAPKPGTGDRPIAYVNGQAVTVDRLLPPMIEAVGGESLAELVLDQTVTARLKDRGLLLTSEMLEAERIGLLRQISEDADTAERLLAELRRNRGLGERRFDALLRRNAGLRLLIKDDVEVNEAALKQEYLLRHGPRYRVRLIVAPTYDKAAELRKRAEAGESFSDLAALNSTDPSAAQGGLLSPISPADAQYPQAIRNALPRLDEQPLSQVIALPSGFALVRLEGKIQPASVEFADVRDDLARSVRQRFERVLMEQLAREMLAEADVIVLDATLKKAWEQRRESVTSQ